MILVVRAANMGLRAGKSGLRAAKVTLCACKVPLRALLPGVWTCNPASCIPKALGKLRETQWLCPEAVLGVRAAVWRLHAAKSGLCAAKRDQQ